MKNLHEQDAIQPTVERNNRSNIFVFLKLSMGYSMYSEKAFFNVQYSELHV